MAALQTPDFWVAVGFLVFDGDWSPSLPGKPCPPDWTPGQKKSRQALMKPHSLREEVQSLLADYQRRQRDATREVDEMLANAQAEAERTAQRGRRCPG